MYRIPSFHSKGKFYKLCLDALAQQHTAPEWIVLIKFSATEQTVDYGTDQAKYTTITSSVIDALCAHFHNPAQTTMNASYSHDSYLQSLLSKVLRFLIFP